MKKLYSVAIAALLALGVFTAGGVAFEKITHEQVSIVSVAHADGEEAPAAPAVEAPAAEAPAAPAEVIEGPSQDEIGNFLKSIGGWAGMGALGIAMIIVQGLMLLFKSSLASFAGKWRLLIVSFLSLASGVIALKLMGVADWGAVLMHSSTLAAIQVFINQLWKQIFVKAD